MPIDYVEEVATCDRGYLCHIASPSIHPRWRPNPEIEWHHVDTRGTSSAPRKIHDFEKRHD